MPLRARGPSTRSRAKSKELVKFSTAQTATKFTESHSTRSAARAQVADTALDISAPHVVEKNHQSACDYLFALNGVHQPQNEWLIVPTRKMDCIRNPHYSSDRLMSSMIGVDGAVFEEALFRNKHCKMKKEQFMKETYESRQPCTATKCCA